VDFLRRENDGEEIYLDYYPSISATMTAAAPDGATPRRIDESLKKTHCPAVPLRGPEAGSFVQSTIFMVQW